MHKSESLRIFEYSSMHCINQLNWKFISGPNNCMQSAMDAYCKTHVSNSHANCNKSYNHARWLAGKWRCFERVSETDSRSCSGTQAYWGFAECKQGAGSFCTPGHYNQVSTQLAMDTIRDGCPGKINFWLRSLIWERQWLRKFVNYTSFFDIDFDLSVSQSTNLILIFRGVPNTRTSSW